MRTPRSRPTDAIAAALSNYFTRAEEVTATIVAAIDESKGYTDTQLITAPREEGSR